MSDCDLICSNPPVPLPSSSLSSHAVLSYAQLITVPCLKHSMLVCNVWNAHVHVHATTTSSLHSFAVCAIVVLLVTAAVSRKHKHKIRLRLLLLACTHSLVLPVVLCCVVGTNIPHPSIHRLFDGMSLSVSCHRSPSGDDHHRPPVTTGRSR